MNAAPFITPEMYCNVKWQAIDQAYWDLKICALKTIGEPVDMSKEEMIAIYEAAKKNMLDCSEAICSSVATADEGETTDATDTEGEQEAEEVDTDTETEAEAEASTKSSDSDASSSRSSSVVGTIAAVVVALTVLYLN